MLENQQYQHLQEDDEINLLDYWRVIWKYKILIGIICSAIVLFSAIYSFCLPKIYKSTATILPAQSDQRSSMMANPAVQNIAPFLGISTSTTNEKIILNILKSRAIRERIVNQFNLKDYYKCLRLDSAIDSLGGATKISPSKDGIISIDIEDKDPEMAANIANAYIEHLNHLNTEFGIGTASRQRRFIAEQLA
ncbi:MAG: Wzz/FepE/Etk N-terminal domain-containing protein, partial [Candidatus Brocadiaceae bacterium]|nr:Wzz/FepE/Etk N-terminal domain-containing protein [Candidatus Brocadiaceae bacterium]